eukprot:917973-Pyramimonas_sp.AAC.1
MLRARLVSFAPDGGAGVRLGDQTRGRLRVGSVAGHPASLAAGSRARGSIFPFHAGGLSQGVESDFEVDEH